MLPNEHLGLFFCAGKQHVAPFVLVDQTLNVLAVPINGHEEA